ncbi:hypothetical protein [Streptomyces sp. SudanB182_2057]|uniref:hypothetical protein n=1 Tax=Streptomyces sp. SudanB182_2057 TaxID=3035281 RepID=UPI003F57801D
MIASVGAATPRAVGSRDLSLRCTTAQNYVLNGPAPGQRAPPPRPTARTDRQRRPCRQGTWAFHPVALDKVPDWPKETTPLPVAAYGWSPGDLDATDERRGWWPQGITTYYDATGRNGTRMMVSWYNKSKGPRVALIDRRATDPRYHYIKLATAKREGNGYVPEVIQGLHAGGLAWYRNRLYVTDSEQNALLVFNTDDIVRTGDRQAPWALLLSRTYKSDAQKADLRFSQVSVDRTSLASPFRRATLIVNGWETEGQSQNVGRWSFAYGPSGSLITQGATATAADVYTIHRGNGIPERRGVQGAVTVRNTMYLSVSRGNQPGYLSTARLGANQEGTAEVRWQVPRGPPCPARHRSGGSAGYGQRRARWCGPAVEDDRVAIVRRFTAAPIHRVAGPQCTAITA